MGMLFSETAHKSDTNSTLVKISIVINIMTKTNKGKKWFVSSYNSQITHHNVSQDRNSAQKLGGKNSSKGPGGALLFLLLLGSWICCCKYPWTTCPGLVLQTMAWSLQHQSQSRIWRIDLTTGNRDGGIFIIRIIINVWVCIMLTQNNMDICIWMIPRLSTWHLCIIFWSISF